MGPVSTTIVIDRPREDVFDFVCDLANRESFCDHFIFELRLERLESSGAGAAARFRVEPPLSKLWMETVIDEADRPHLIHERGHCGRLDRIPASTAWELVSGPGGATELRLTFWTEPSHPLDRAREMLGAARWWRRRWARALRRLRELLESGSSVEPVGVAGADRVPAVGR
jgi:hypothetical protein